MLASLLASWLGNRCSSRPAARLLPLASHRRVGFQALGQGVAGQGHDALILLALVRGDGDYHVAIANEGLDVAVAPVLAVAVAGQGTQLALVGALGQQQGYRALALGLQCQAALEFQGAGQ